MIVLNTSLSMSCSKIFKYNEWQNTEQINFQCLWSIHSLHAYINVNILMNKHLIMRIT